MPIFKLGLAIPVKSHVWKFGSDWLSLSRVIVSTNIFLWGRIHLLGGFTFDLWCPFLNSDELFQSKVMCRNLVWIGWNRRYRAVNQKLIKRANLLNTDKSTYHRIPRTVNATYIFLIKIIILRIYDSFPHTVSFCFIYIFSTLLLITNITFLSLFSFYVKSLSFQALLFTWNILLSPSIFFSFSLSFYINRVFLFQIYFLH